MGVLKKKNPDKMPRHRWMFFLLFGLIVLVLILNFYFAFVIDNNDVSTQTEPSKIMFSPMRVPSSSSSKNIILLDPSIKKNELSLAAKKSASQAYSRDIEDSLNKIPTKYFKISSSVHNEIHKLWTHLQSSVSTSAQLWSVAKEWVGARHVVPPQSPLLGSILETLSVAKIIKAQNAPGGTQLKILITLEGGQRALFKPQWYKRDELIEGPVYSGKDRHNAEIAAFHLSLLLGLRRVPLTAGRVVNLRSEIKPVASKSLLKTFLKDEKNNSCFYGDCHYCSRSDAVCGNGELMEGAVILMLPESFKLKQYRSPWQRTYKENKAAKWEVDINYCDRLKSTKMYNPRNGPRLLDLIDAAIFDYLIDNGDRHHYEVLINVTGAAVMFIDNGKSFGHPFQDHVDILAPLYQCCVLRKTTWERLIHFTGDSLGPALRKLLSTSHVSPVLSSEHYVALNRRLRVVFAAVELCFKKQGKTRVLIDDGYR